MSTHDPHSVLESLKQQAQRRAPLRMSYSAAVLPHYRGPFAQDTAAERELLAAEYHAMGKAAEETRRGGGPSAPTPPPPRPVAEAGKHAPCPECDTLLKALK